MKRRTEKTTHETDQESEKKVMLEFDTFWACLAPNNGTCAYISVAPNNAF